MKDKINFGGIVAEPGQKNQGWSPVPRTDYKLPVTVINGAKEGKTVLVTSSIHGCEYPSIEAVFRLAENTDPNEVSGQIVVINPVNVNAFLERRPYVMVEDGENLNRCFPGNPEGSLSYRVAWYLTQEFISRADFYIDTHGGDVPEVQPDYVFYPGVGDDEEALAFAEEASQYVLHAKYRIKSAATNHAYTHAGVIGVPSLELELGDSGYWTEIQVQQYSENIRNLMKFLGVFPGQPEKPRESAYRIRKSMYLDADATGRWYALVRGGDQIREGQLIGRIVDLFGNVLVEYTAEFDAEVQMVARSIGISKGDPIIAYGI